MAKQMSLGMIKMWERMLDETTAPVMARVKIMESRYELLAQHDVEKEMGIDKIRRELKIAEERVDALQDALERMGIESGNYRKTTNRANHARYETAVRERSKAYNPPAVQGLIAAIAQAKEQIRLAAMPETVRGILDEIKKTMVEVVPVLDTFEKRAVKLIKEKKVEIAEAS